MKLILTILFLLQISLFAQTITIDKITVDGTEFAEETKYLNIKNYENDDEITLSFTTSLTLFEKIELRLDSSSGTVF